jgi:hypothetical protein
LRKPVLDRKPIKRDALSLGGCGSRPGRGRAGKGCGFRGGVGWRVAVLDTRLSAGERGTSHDEQQDPDQESCAPDGGSSRVGNPSCHSAVHNGPLSRLRQRRVERRWISYGRRQASAKLNVRPILPRLVHSGNARQGQGVRRHRCVVGCVAGMGGHVCNVTVRRQRCVVGCVAGMGGHACRAAICGVTTVQLGTADNPGYERALCGERKPK